MGSTDFWLTWLIPVTPAEVLNFSNRLAFTFLLWKVQSPWAPELPTGALFENCQ